MEATLDTRRQVRNALSIADELSRSEHEAHAERASQTLAALRTTLGDIDLEMEHRRVVRPERVEDLAALAWKLRRLRDVEVIHKADLNMLLADVAALERRLRVQLRGGEPHPVGPSAADDAALREQPFGIGVLAHVGRALHPFPSLRELGIVRGLAACAMVALAGAFLAVKLLQKRR